MATGRKYLLNDMQIRAMVRAAVPVAKSDGDGLTFTLSAKGTAAWTLRYRLAGRRQEITLGRYPDMSIASARELAARKRLDAQTGIDPADVIRKAKTRTDWTLRQLITDYRTKVLAGLADSSQKSYGRNLKRVENSIGSLSVRSAAPADIVAVIEKAELPWVETYTLWCVLRALFQHAAGQRLIDASPCAGISLKAILGKRPPVRKRLMLTFDELHVLTNAAMSVDNLTAVRVLLGTGVRSSELFTAEKENVHLDEARWHIPSSKTGPEMDIPLAPIVVDWFRVLIDRSGDSAYVLPARVRTRPERFGGDAHISKDCIREAIDYWIDNTTPAPDIRRFTPHDLRSTMKSHMRALGVPRDVSEMCLNHALPGVEGVYDLHTYYAERRAALALWARFLESAIASKQWNVTPLNRTA